MPLQSLPPPLQRVDIMNTVISHHVFGQQYQILASKHGESQFKSQQTRIVNARVAEKQKTKCKLQRKAH
jgi:hypothetical protein